jgi:hypothetical protein
MLRLIKNIQSKRYFSTNEKSPLVAPVQSFYRRPLPKHLISFSSPEGKAIFRQALEDGGLESYWALAEQFHTQSEPACTLQLVIDLTQ